MSIPSFHNGDWTWNREAYNKLVQLAGKRVGAVEFVLTQVTDPKLSKNLLTMWDFSHIADEHGQ